MPFRKSCDGSLRGRVQASSRALWLRKGRIVSPGTDSGESESLLAWGERIIAVGKDDEVARHPLAGTAEQVDAAGRRVIPGIVDAHVHFAAAVEGRTAVDLGSCATLEEVVERLSRRAETLPPSAWVRGMHFDHNRFAEKRLPERRELDRIPNPVLLTRLCYHAHCANTPALRAAGVLDAPDLPEGFQRDAEGTLTGVVLESGADRLYRAYRAAGGDEEALLEGMARMMEEWASFGITSFNTTSAEHIGIVESLGAYQELQRRGRQLQRVVVHTNSLPPFGMQSGFGSSLLRFGGLKLFADGGFCARTGAMSFVYPGEETSGYRGLLAYGDEELYALFRDAQQRGVQIAVHCIGDRALDQILDAFERAQRTFPRSDLRHRVIHCYVVRPDQRKRMRALGLAADVQPRFLADEIDIAEANLPGPVRPFSYAWRSLLDEDLLVTGSSDCPAAHPNPWLGVEAAVNRVRALERTPAGGWGPEQKLTLDEALALFTKNAAEAVGLDEAGRLEPGMLADFLLLEDDPWEMDPEKLGNVRVWRTYRGGELLFERTR